jgi:hypothetical protein
MTLRHDQPRGAGLRVLALEQPHSQLRPEGVP